jgi:hypothetical protein
MKIKPKVDNKILAKSIKIKAQQESFATLDNQQFIQSRITSDPLVKMKANLLDLQASYKTYKSGEIGEAVREVLELMEEELRNTTKELFLLSRNQRLQSTVSTTTFSSSSSSSSSGATPSETSIFHHGI